MRGQSIHIKRERDTYGVRAAQLGKRMVKVFPAPQRNRFFDKAGKKQPEDTGEKLRSAASLFGACIEDQQLHDIAPLICAGFWKNSVSAVLYPRLSRLRSASSVAVCRSDSVQSP